MRKLHTPKRVTLPNDRTFVAKYKNVPRFELPANVTMARRYRGRLAAGRKTTKKRTKKKRVFFDTLKKKIEKNPLVKKLGKKALTNAPKLYSYGTSKIKKKQQEKFYNQLLQSR